jgi:D-arabinose 1-dehydrogenase-like Zn-dependent alcohol dehydrogenase
MDNITGPSIRHDFDVMVPLTASAICAIDLHSVRGTVPGMQEGTVPGRKTVGRVQSR